MEKITANIHEAKTNLSKLLKHVEDGDEVIIARAGKPLARLVPLSGEPNKPFRRKLGWAKGFIKIADNFDEPDFPDEYWEKSIFPVEPDKE